MFYFSPKSLYPNKKQQIQFKETFFNYRSMGNYYLNKARTQYQETGKDSSYSNWALCLIPNKNLADYFWRQKVTNVTLQGLLKQLSSIFNNFLEHGNKFLKLTNYCQKQLICCLENSSVKSDDIKFNKLEFVKARIPQKISEEIRVATVSKNSDNKCSAAILFDTEDWQTNKKSQISGINRGLTSLLTVFNSTKFLQVCNCVEAYVAGDLGSYV